MKLGVFYRHEQAVGGARGQLLEKVMVGWQGRDWNWVDACTGKDCEAGLGRAQEVLAVADGAPWIWNVVRDRWGQAHQLLDSTTPANISGWWEKPCTPGTRAVRRRWVERRLHRLRHGKETAVLREIASLPRPRGQSGQSDPTGAELLCWTRVPDELCGGRPSRLADWQRDRRIGVVALANAVASAPASFWTPLGLRHLDALEEARDNGHWDELWLTP